MTEKSAHVLISEHGSSLPYSKGLTASRIMVTGLSPYRSYEVAERIEERLLALGTRTIPADRLTEIAEQVLHEVAGERYAKSYRRWRALEALDIPVMLLIGGATGVGKSTVATQLAARLGIVRVVATDAIREVMRTMFSRELMPTLYTSSFDADEALREPPTRESERLVVGFREQTAAVNVGLRGILDRAAVEGTSVIIEGAHVVPGFLDLETWEDRALVVPLVLTVEEAEQHQTHFVTRSADARPAVRYQRGFEKIRKLQKYVKSQALAHEVPVVPNYSLDQCLAAVIDLVMQAATARSEGAPDTGQVSQERPKVNEHANATMEGRTA
jgi:2-phosphoglycerate kinase